MVIRRFRSDVEDKRAATRGTARSYQVTARLESAFSVILGVELEIRRNATVSVHSVAAVDFSLTC